VDHPVKRRKRYKGAIRDKNESYEDYRARRWAEKQVERIRLSGVMVHESKKYKQKEPGITYRENV